MRRLCRPPLATLLLAGLLCLPCPAAAETRASSYVLIVAHNKSLDRNVKPLRFADDDGARYWELFSKTGARVSLLSVLDPETARTHPAAARVAQVPWKHTLLQEVERIRGSVTRDNKAGRRTRFTFIYVGHGNVAKTGEGYVNLQDLKLRRQDLFAEIVDRVPASAIHLIIDACKSYFLISRGPGDWRDDRSGHTYRDEVRAFLAKRTIDTHPHVGAILSTSGDEEVHEWSAFRSGVFSHQLRSALAGAADINHDGRIEYSEVGAFIASANYKVALARARIRPFILPPPAARNATLMDLPDIQGRVVLELGQNDRGRFSVEDDRGVRQADLHKGRDRVRLSLASGRRHYIRHGDKESVLDAGRQGLVLLASLPQVEARSDPRGAVDAAYRGSLFSLPFSRSFYEGFLATSDLPSVSFTAAGPDIAFSPRLSVDLAYGLSSGLLGQMKPQYDDTVQHNISLGVRWTLHSMAFLSLRGEFGFSSDELDTRNSSLMRFGVLAGVGLYWPLASWARISLQADVGYQALVKTDHFTGKPSETSNSPGGLKLGSMLQLTIHPWRDYPRLGLLLRGGFYGHLARVEDNTRTYLVPEGGAGLTYGF